MHRPRFIYVSLLRTGSRSIRTTLFPTNPTGDDAPCYWNRSALEIRDDFARKGWNWDDCFKFSVVRNPWDRLVSAFEFWRPIDGESLGTRNSSRPLLSFSAWVRVLSRGEDPGANALLDQQSLLADNEGASLMDLVIPFENLAVGWATVCLRTGLSSRLARTHQTVHRHYSRYYDQTTKRLVADMCAADIRAYGYRFRMLSQQSTLLDEARYRFAKTYSFARGTAARVKRLETVLRKTPTGV